MKHIINCSVNFVLPDFQTSIGYIDVKPSAPVYFYVQKNVSHSTLGIVPFEITRLNIGETMSASAGIFTAPRNGIYSFDFSGVGRYPSESSNLRMLEIALVVNGDDIGRGLVSEIVHSYFDSTTTIALQSIINLKRGDQVWMSIQGISANVYLYDDPNLYTHFTGRLLY